MKKIKILLADDHNLVMYGVDKILSGYEEFEVVGEAITGAEAVVLYEELAPDVILMDISMPELNGLEATKKIKAINSDVKIIILTTHADEQYMIRADMAGADGYLFKNCDKDELYESIYSVMKDVNYYSKVISADLVAKIRSKSYLKDLKIENEITKREVEIIKAISEGLSNKQISEKLFISDRTVNTHRTNIMLKLNVKNSVELVVKALEKKLI